MQSLGAEDVSEDEVYRKVQRDHRKEDAHYHVSDMYGDDKADALSDEVYDCIIDRYESSHDCNIAENDIWESVIRYALEDKRILSDSEIETLWDELTDVPFDEDADGNLVLAEDWRHFTKGTEREEIWHWFDSTYSRGVHYLLCSH